MGNNFTVTNPVRKTFDIYNMTLLRDILRDETMSPLSNNVYAVLMSLVYVKLGMETAYWIRWRSGKRRASRTLVHLCLSSVNVFWPLYDRSDWSWRLNVIVPLSVACRFFYKVRNHELIPLTNIEGSMLTSSNRE
jgi:hypothetical protein